MKFITLAMLGTLCLGINTLCCAEWHADRQADGVYVLRNESENWGGIRPGCVLPMNSPVVAAKKRFNLLKIPREVLEKAEYAALRLHIGILDNSITKPGKPNGLTEHFKITVNGHELKFKTSDARFPRTYDSKKKRVHGWVSIEFPAEWLKHKDTAEVTIAKTDSGDDFLYPGIDNSVVTTDSSVSFNGGKTFAGQWHDSAGKGEFMMRLVLAGKRELSAARYDFRTGQKDDRAGILSFINSTPEYSVMEIQSIKMDFSRPVTFTVEYEGEKAPSVFLQAPDGAAGWALKMDQVSGGRIRGVMLNQDIPCKVMIGHAKTVRLKSAEFSFYPSFAERDERVNMNPAMSKPRGRDFSPVSGCIAAKNKILLGTAKVKMTIDTAKGIRIAEIQCSDIAGTITRHPDDSAVFKILAGGKHIYTGADARNIRIAPEKDGAKILFDLPDAGLEGTMTCMTMGDEIMFGLSLRNSAGKDSSVMTAFPHLDGLVLSEKSAGDYYLFPWGGGIIADRGTLLRTIYGANDAWFQLIDIFSPERGGGFYMRIADKDIIYKGFNLRKNKNAKLKYRVLAKGRPGKNDLSIQFTDSLEPHDGIGMSVDYQRDEYRPGETKSYPPAFFGGHAGNWKSAMRLYADWAHKTWKFRPLPSKLTNRWNLDAGKSLSRPLFTGKEYDRRYIGRKYSEIIEMVCYWTASEKAPWDTPMDRVSDLGEEAVRQEKAHFGYWTDPVLGKKVYSVNRGDYDGYNPHWGGLPALRKYIEEFRSNGQALILYTDPVIVDGNTKLGRKHGAEWGIINPAWSDPYRCPKNPKSPAGLACHYFSYCMCLNDRDYSDWVARNMARLIRETGADGIRLDEYGHAGYICLSGKHRHIFPGKGQNVWLRALDFNLKAMRMETDKFKPDALILSEYLGADGLSANLDGALCYDICNRTNELRPLPVNLFRFYFRECKLFELNYFGMPHDDAQNYWMFNAAGVYNSGLYSEQYRLILNKYAAAFNGKAEPLIDTLVPYVYANRFEAPDGTAVYTVINQTGSSVSGPLFRAGITPGFRFIDLLSGKELKLSDRKGDSASVSGLVSNNGLLVIGKIRK